MYKLSVLGVSFLFYYYIFTTSWVIFLLYYKLEKIENVFHHYSANTTKLEKRERKSLFLQTLQNQKIENKLNI